jgi:hypothetical protein
VLFINFSPKEFMGKERSILSGAKKTILSWQGSSLGYGRLRDLYIGRLYLKEDSNIVMGNLYGV